jgi:NAD(P)-dependent dehydrogenase (short-subunit alcohol dehydrogenase family)
MLLAGAAGIVCLDQDAARGRSLGEELGERFHPCAVDVANESEVNSAIAAGCAKFGAIHVAIHAAAIGTPGKLLGRSGPISMEHFDRVIKVNLYGALHLMRAAAARMQGNPPNEHGERGVLINVSSGAAWEGQAGQIAYSASKAALVGMTLPLMRELSTHGIRVMTIAPGAFDTPIYAQAPPKVREGVIAQSLFPKRMGTAGEFAMLIEEVVRNPMHNGRSIRLDAGLILGPGV